MARLMGDLFQGSPLVVWPIAALALFTFAFVSAVVRAYLRGASQYEVMAALPLDAGRPADQRTGGNT